VPGPRGFDGFAWSESGQPNGWPCSAQRGRVGPMDGPNNPTWCCRLPCTWLFALAPALARYAKRPERGILRIWRREWDSNLQNGPLLSPAFVVFQLSVTSMPRHIARHRPSRRYRNEVYTECRKRWCKSQEQ